MILYRSFYEAVKELPRDIQGEIYTAIMEYGLYGNETENLKPIAKSIFTLMKPIIDVNNKRYDNGCKGGRPKKENGKENQKQTEPYPNKNQTKTKIEPNNNDNYNEDKNVDINVVLEPSSEPIVKKERIDYDSIVTEFNAMLAPPLPKVQTLSDARRRAMKARVDEHGIEAVKKVFENVYNSKFLRGETENGWKCYFDWIFNPKNFIKILEGNYANCRTNNSEKQRANEYALRQFAINRSAREGGMVDEVENPF